MEKSVSERRYVPGNETRSRDRAPDSARGYSVMELLVTVAILLVTAVMALPLVTNASRSYRMRSAVNSVTGTIQVTRYQAISNGFPFRIVMDSTTSTYQIWNNTCGNANPCWAKVGSAVPLSGSSVAATINQTTALDLHPSGQVQASTGALTFSLTYQGAVENITVSKYGNINVSP